MRIVQLVETLEVGGLERVAVDLALGLRRAGHWAGVYCFFHAGPLQRELAEQGIPVTEFHKDKQGNPSTVWAMARQLRDDRADVLHGHNPGVHHAAALAKAIARVPVCLNTRHSATTSQGVPYQERYFRMARPLTSHVVFVCDYVRKLVAPRLDFPESRVSVIRNGVAVERFLANPASPGEHRPLRFGTIGRLVPAKGHSVLIDAFTRIASRLPEAELQIFGYGPMQEELGALIRRNNMQGRIRLEGPTSDSAATLSTLDVFVFSSVNEGLPLVILEAMAAGLPVVSTRIGGVPEVAPEHTVAWYCDPGDPEGLAHAMLDAAAGNLAARGSEARRLAGQQFGIDKMCAAYASLYERLLR
jgi:glycosyltransferase involved in cell wall biosynthesis